MASPNTRVAKADMEAAAWHARLGVRSVSTETIEEFFAWRSDVDNAEAYRRVEKVWAVSGGLAGASRIQAAVAEAMARKVDRKAKRRMPRTLFGAAAVTAAGVLVVSGWFWHEARTVFSTDIGEQRVVQLADGSTVRLDTGSQIRVRFERRERRIELGRGQALFTVAHDAARPFVVHAGDVSVTAIGTVFDVRRTGEDVRVTLVSGAVDVAGAADARASRLTAGRQAQVTPTAVTTQPVDVAKATSWTDGRIVFEDTPLRDAVAEVNRYLTSGIVLDARDLTNVPINGVFRAGDREAFALAAAEGLGLNSRVRPDGVLLLSKRTNN